MALNPDNTHQFFYNDFLTNEPKIFDTSTSSSGNPNFYMYTQYKITRPSRACPVYLGEIFNDYTFNSINLGATIGTLGSATNLNTETVFLDGVPSELSLVGIPPAEIRVTGKKVQAIPSNIFNKDNDCDCGCSSYPVNFSDKIRCYFMLRTRKIANHNIYSDWLYYVNVRLNWSSIRDAFISSLTIPFSINQKDIISSNDFIQLNKDKGYYT